MLEAYLAYCRGETTSPSLHCYNYVNTKYLASPEAPLHVSSLPSHMSEDYRGPRRDAMRMREAKEASTNAQLLRMADYRDVKGAKFRHCVIAKVLHLTLNQVVSKLKRLRKPAV